MVIKVPAVPLGLTAVICGLARRVTVEVPAPLPPITTEPDAVPEYTMTGSREITIVSVGSGVAGAEIKGMVIVIEAVFANTKEATDV